MSAWKRPLAFLALYVSYVIMGGYMFKTIECPGEKEAKRRWETEKRKFVKLIEERTGDLHVIQDLIEEKVMYYDVDTSTGMG